MTDATSATPTPLKVLVYSDDVNGGTWGLFQINNGEWTTYYGHPWSADLDHNGLVDGGDLGLLLGAWTG